MMKIVQLKCDNPKCDWTAQDNPFDWHNKKCPKCKDCIIIDDKDFAILKGIQALEDLGLVKTGKAAEECTEEGIKIRIDTSVNRSNPKPNDR